MVVGSWEPCFPESQRCPAAAELPDDPRGGGQPRSPPVPCVGAEFLDLPLPNTVPPTKSFCCQREESHTLPPAQLLRTTQLLVILDWQSMTMFKSINRVLLCLIQLLTEGVNLSVSQICAMKLRFPLRQAGVDSDLVQNIWVIIWWVGARGGPTRLGNSEFTQIFWVFPVYIADFWQTFWVIWENGSNWSNLRLRISVSALGRLKNHNIPHLRPNFTMFMPLSRPQLKISAFSGKFNVVWGGWRSPWKSKWNNN